MVSLLPGWCSQLCCALPCRTIDEPMKKEATIMLVEPVESGLAWMNTLVRRDKLSDFQRLQRKTKTGTKGDVSRFFRCKDMDETGEDKFADQWNSLVRAMLPTRFASPELAGTGGQGVVLTVSDKDQSARMALKLVYFGNRKLVSMVRTCREIQILKVCDHPNICQMHEVFSPEPSDDLSYVIILFEEVHTTLSEVLRDCAQNPRPSHDTTSRWLYQLLCAVQFLHERNIIHRDLKPSNIGLTLTKEPPKCQFKENFCNVVKLLDMGMARGIDGDRPLTPELGTYSYMAPELLLENHVDFGNVKMSKRNTVHVRPTGMYENTSGFQDYDKSIDIWAVGAIFAEVLLADGVKFFSSSGIIKACDMVKEIGKTVPICDTNEYKDYVGAQNTSFLEELKTVINPTTTIDYRLRENLLPADDDVTDNLNGENAKDLLKRMLKWNPEERISARDALQHPYFLHLISENELLASQLKYKEILPPTGFNDETLISEVSPGIVTRWREQLQSEIPWMRQEIMVNDE